MKLIDGAKAVTGVLSGVLLFYLLGKFGVPVLMPFLLAGGVVLFVHPCGKRLSRLSALRPGICNVAVLLGILALLGGGAYLGGYFLWREASAFYAWLSESADSLASALGGLFATKGQGIALPAFLQKILELPQVSAFLGDLDQLFQTLVQALLARLGETLTGMALDAATSLPTAALSGLVFVLSCFYLSLDGEKLFSWVLSCFEQKSRNRVRGICASVAQALRGYLRAYGLIFLLTATELLIGFLLIGVRYALLLAVLVALIDLLPVLGSGAVLLPWGVISLLSGDVRVGAGVLILYGVITLVRQIAEPKIVGDSVGLHPLATLASMYIGFRLFGALGLVTGPCAALIVRTVWQHSKRE
ncbi:MAG: sporulation integral membrane protein YtvI [Ruminococcaceae bacterium]|nr:sporulation integral membrane protein YtvI [Oscillospiraceae bacterium]